MNEHATAHTLYRKLLRLYPREFRERLGESMEQTFHDLYHDRQQSQKGLFRFVVSTFLDTTIGILQEHSESIKEINPMKNTLTNLRSPALISLLLVVPFMIMEIVNRRGFNEGFPIPLFVIMWLLPILFMIILMPIVRTIRAGNSIMASPVSLLIRVVILVLVAWLWTGILIDQMPCFLGVPNCD